MGQWQATLRNALHGYGTVFAVLAPAPCVETEWIGGVKFGKGATPNLPNKKVIFQRSFLTSRVGVGYWELRDSKLQKKTPDSFELSFF